MLQEALNSTAGYCLASVALVVVALVALFAAFEHHRPQARELVVVAVMCALCVVARLIFAPLPFFKPLLALVLLSGAALGRGTGFMCGSVAMLVSDIFLGFGPWAPWQMLAYGLAGAIAGWLASAGVLKTENLALRDKLKYLVAAFIIAFVPVGVLLDTCTVLLSVAELTPDSVIAVYAAGFPVNLVQAVVTLVVLFIVANPLFDQLARIKRKYGLFERG